MGQNDDFQIPTLDPDWLRWPTIPGTDPVPTPEEVAAFAAHMNRREYRGNQVRCVICEKFFPRSIDTDPTGLVVCPEDRRRTDDWYRENGLG